LSRVEFPVQLDGQKMTASYCPLIARKRVWGDR
jgi:hypothetical protein